MCTTCGCSGDGEAKITALGEPAGHAHRGLHEQEHGHPHAPGHSHEHPHSHPHEHEHEHEPAPVSVSVETSPRMLHLEQEVLAKNNRLAERNRGWFAGREILALNVTSSPGAGKTTLLTRTIRDLNGELRISVIEGDQETVRDAERIRAAGARAVQINTGSGCHLDAEMVARSLPALAPPLRSVVIIENVGNLVCPALFDLGEHAKVVVVSVTEGEDKPLKYPHMFRASELMLLNKVDLLPHVEFDPEKCAVYARQVNPKLRILPVSAARGDGLDAWYDWLRGQAVDHLATA